MLPWLREARERFAARPDKARPHVVEALLASPVSIEPQHPITIEGALGCAVIAAVTGQVPHEAGLGGVELVDIPIPIADGERCGRLVARASVAQGGFLERERHIRRRTRSERLGVPRVVETTGTYKAFALAAPTRVTASLRFHVVADAERLHALLRGIYSLGRGRQGGLGEVAFWRVTPTGEDESWVSGGRIMRPLPVASAAAAHKEFGRSTDVAVVGYRAPYWHVQARHLCALPGAA